MIFTQQFHYSYQNSRQLFYFWLTHPKIVFAHPSLFFGCFINGEIQQPIIVHSANSFNNFKLFLMKKATLKSFATYEQQFRDGLQCSSIRLNAEEQNEIMEIRNNNRNVTKLQPKKYEENSLNGFQQSLSMSGNQDNILELMRSKSAINTRPKDEKSNHHKLKSGVQNINSLYNTSSFDEMTMKMSINKTNNNISHLNNLTNITENQEQRKLKKPQEMQKYKVTYADHEMKIMINEINRNQQKTHTIHEELSETQQQREIRQKKVNNFIKNQSLLGSLKCSNVESQHSQRIQESSFQQPYFKVASQVLKQDPYQNAKISIQVKQPVSRPNLHVVIPKSPRSPDSRLQSPQTAKSHKKITLRDYIHLNELTSKAMDKQPSQSSISSPLTPAMARRASFSRKKKAATSNNEVLARIKTEILTDLKLMQNNIHILSEYFSGQDEELDPQHQEIMKLYTISRMIKQKMLMGNDSIIKYLKESNQKKGI